MKALRCGLALAAAALVSSCGDGGSDPPPVIPGTAQILVKGGTGTTGAGGKGNVFRVHNYTGGDVRILRNGAVDASFALPAVSPYLGSNPRTISGNVALTPLPLGAGLATIPGDDGVNPATGLRVLPGATLTLNPNYDTDNADGDANPATGTREIVYLYLTDGMHIQGTLRAGRRDAVNGGDGLSPDAARLDLNVMGNVVVAPSGVIDLRGTDGIIAGDGGSIGLNLPGLVVCQGTIDASGGSGNAGGNGGQIGIASVTDTLYVTGTLQTHGGGSGNPNAGGSAGEIYLTGALGTYVAGTLSAVGGNGTLGGGAGGKISVVNASLGPLVSSAEIRSIGGNGTGGLALGGSADEIVLGTWSGSLRVAGRIEARGGNGTIGGGKGGEVQIVNELLIDPPDEPNQIGASIDTRGGGGQAGGDAGAVRIDINNMNNDHRPSKPGEHLLFIGYERIESSGGDGATGSHAGDPAAMDHGAILITTDYGFDGRAYATGGVYNEVPFVSCGGSGSTGGGGDGGLVVLSADTDYPDSAERSVTNAGPIDVRGGDGATAGGIGGRVRIRDRYRATNAAAVDASGGAGGSGAGGIGGAISFTCLEGLLYNTGALTANGGASATGAGGNAAGVSIYGEAAIALTGGRVATAGALTAVGGASGAAAGGRGGGLVVSSLNPGAVSAVWSPRDVSGGAGSPPGDDGTIYIDGLEVAR